MNCPKCKLELIVTQNRPSLRKGVDMVYTRYRCPRCRAMSERYTVPSVKEVLQLEQRNSLLMSLAGKKRVARVLGRAA